MGFKIFGQVKELESQTGISNLIVEAFDEDLFTDDMLGKAKTGNNGSFSIEYVGNGNKSVLRDKPDVYLVVKDNNGKVLKSTRNNVILDVNDDVEIDVQIPNLSLFEAGVVKQKVVP